MGLKRIAARAALSASKAREPLAVLARRGLAYSGLPFQRTNPSIAKYSGKPI